MATKADFAQKLLHDLRLRKERMATAQNSDMYGNSRQNFKGSKETRMLDTVGPKVGSRYGSSSNSQKSPATVQATTQLVPYGKGHQSGQVADLSMALAYAFDNKGKLKRLDIASNGALINLLQQIGRRSVQQSFEIQCQSTNQYPTLTNLHINEIAKGTQKLNKILRACSSGINIDNGSIDIGKELWKGAMELEQSLSMLVSLQEASDNTVSQQRKSRIKLLDDNGDSEDDSTTVSLEEQKKVERPIFSFDKPHKNTKAIVQTNLQQNLTAATYLEDAKPKPERQKNITSKTTLHRRSASCGSEIQTPQLTDSSKSKHNAARLPNVIAKLMGLEELPQNTKPKVAIESPDYQQRSRFSVPIHPTQRSSRNVDSKTEHNKNPKNQVDNNREQSNKITTLISHKVEQQDTYRSNSGHKTTLDLHKTRTNEEEREGMKSCVRESKAAIFQINELQNRITHLNQDDGKQKEAKKETKVRSMKQDQQVANATETLQEMGTENRSLVMADAMQADTLENSNRKESKKVTGASLHTQQRQKQSQDFQQKNRPNEPYGKKLKAENRSQQKENQRSELRKRERQADKLHNSKIVARDSKVSQKQLLTKTPIVKKKKGEDIVLAASKATLSNRQKEDPVRDDKSTESDDTQKSTVSLKLNQSSLSTDELPESQISGVCATSATEAKCTYDSPRKVVSEIKPPEASPMIKTNVEITKTVIAPKTIAKTPKPQKPTNYRLKQSKLGKINMTQTAAEAYVSIPQPTGKKPGIDEPRNPLAYEGPQQNDNAAHMETKDHALREEPSLDSKEVTKLLPEEREKLVPDEVKDIPQIIATAGQVDCNHNSYDEQQKQQQPIKMEKQPPLTEDEMFLKQELIKSHLFLNTAEALFKLNIPISILNYASEQICEEKDSKIIQDCGYEFLKRKGIRQETIYSSINKSVSYTIIRSLDDLVRQVHKDFEVLRSYRRSGKDEYDYVNRILEMLESDIYNKHPDLNSMWDFGWDEVMLPCTKMDEVISNIDQLLLEELMDELINDCFAAVL